MRTAYVAHKDDDDFIQPGVLYRQVLSPTNRDHLVGNIIWHLSQGVERVIQERAVNDYLMKVDPDLGARVAKGLSRRTPRPASTRSRRVDSSYRPRARHHALLRQTCQGVMPRRRRFLDTNRASRSRT